MKIVAISQRIDEIKDYGEVRDSLDENWSKLFGRMDAALVQISNYPDSLPTVLGRLKPDAIVLSGALQPSPAVRQ